MHLYNQSLCVAQVGSENVGLAYGNRSACFFHLKMFDECLTDIELAKKANYPQQLMRKLEKRHEDCSKLKETTPQREENVPKLSYEADKKFPGMANVLKIERNDVYGRHIVAKCDIDVSKTVLVEDAFLLKNLDNDFNSCTICLKSFANFIACDQCSNAMYCSSACFDKKSLHEPVECSSLIDTKSDGEFFVRLVAFGLNTFASIESWMEFVESAVKEKTEPDSFNDNLSKYRAFMQLNSFYPAGARTECAVQAYKAYKNLIFHRAIKKLFDTEKRLRFLMHLCLHHVLIGCNFFQVLENIRRAFIIQSYFNHSCTPNLHVIEHKNKAIGITLRPIKNGEQVFISYTADIMGNKPVTYQQKYLLERFGFQCKCERCKPKSSTSTSINFQSDPDFQLLIKELKKRPDLDFDEGKFLMLQEKCIGLLSRFGNMQWCKEMGIVMQTYGIIVSDKLKRQAEK